VHLYSNFWESAPARLEPLQRGLGRRKTFQGSGVLGQVISPGAASRSGTSTGGGDLMRTGAWVETSDVDVSEKGGKKG